MISFERYCEPEENVEATKAALIQTIDALRQRIDANIRLEKIVANDVPEFNDYPADLGFWGKRTSSIR